MNIRLCTQEDKEKWIELNRKFMEFELVDDDFWNHTNAFSDEDFSMTYKEALDNPKHITLMMIEENGEQIGFMNLITIFSVWAHGKALILDDLYIEEEYRGKGLGCEVLKYIETYAMTNGYKRLQFQSEFTNQGANNFYTRLGYQSTDMHFYVKNFDLVAFQVC